MDSIRLGSVTTTIKNGARWSKTSSTIGVMSHERHGVSNHRRLVGCTMRLLKLTTRKSAMLLCYSQLCEEFTGGGFSSQNGFPSQRVSKLESVSHVNVAIVTFTLIISYLSMELWDLQASDVDVGVNGITQLGDWYIGVWIYNYSRYALVILYSSTNLPRCVMPFRSQAHAFSLYCPTYDNIPADIRRNDNVIITSKWHHDVVLT